MKAGIAGKIASAFLESKLSILLMIGLALIGVFSSTLIPREEDPQINVPMVDIMVAYPGASPKEVETKVLEPLEKVLSNIKGVEHLHSSAMNGKAMIIVQFLVNQDVERSYVKIYDELLKHQGILPEGASQPMIKSRSIDDVPILGLTFWSKTYNDFQIRQIAEEVVSGIKPIKGIAQMNILGGQDRQIKIELDKDKMNQLNVDPFSVIQMIKANNAAMQSGHFVQHDRELLVSTGDFLKTKEDVENLIVGAAQNQPIYLKDIAKIKDGPGTTTNYVAFGYGQNNPKYQQAPSEYPAVTLSISKIKGADAMGLSKQVLEKVTELQKHLIPNEVKMEVTRNYGETASHKVNELLFHLLLAVVAVTVLVTLAMGWRGGLVVFFSVPLTLLLTLFSYYILGYTLNRITLFALVFVVGIVVDDSIIVAENMHRHFKGRKLPFREAAIYAINEVGNPTILATLTVIAAVLPMAFVSGMMGPYMSPMPIGASIAMLLSLFIALTITPYLGYHLLREKEKQSKKIKKAEKPNWIYRFYNKYQRPFLDHSKKRNALLGITVLLLLGSVALFFTKTVKVKMLPFDNKNEFQVVVDMPEGTTLERTAAVVREVSNYLSTVSEVTNYQSYVGNSSPITFNGLVRHYDLRRQSNQADIQVNLLHKDDRKEQSHEIAKKVRNGLLAIGKSTGANIKVVEVPPGPPVLSTIVAEVYGPDYQQQIKVASEVKQLLAKTPGIVDLDWSVEAPQTDFHLKVDKDKAMRQGVSSAQIVGNLTQLLTESQVSTLHNPEAYQTVPITLALANGDKSSLNDLLNLGVKNQQGQIIPIKNLVTVEKDSLQPTISRKDQQQVVYVLADMAGSLESPVYAILGMEQKLKQLKLPTGYSISDLYMGQPKNNQNFVVKWDGEWQITLEVFRDLGIAFLVVMVIIYMLIVGWFQDFRTPIIMMIAIPLSLIGIVIGHWLLGAYFTATSFIGMIALAGIMVRNSVLLIDFIEIRLKEGMPIKDAIIDAGIVRTTPILLTTGAVVIGAAVILFDPIFQGLAISLVGGAIISTMLTLLVVPLIYYIAEHKKWEKVQANN